MLNNSFLPPHEVLNERLCWKNNDTFFKTILSSFWPCKQKRWIPTPTCMSKIHHLRFLGRTQDPYCSCLESRTHCFWDCIQIYQILCLKLKVNCINNGIYSKVKSKCYWFCIQIKIQFFFGQRTLLLSTTEG